MTQAGRTAIQLLQRGKPREAAALLEREMQTHSHDMDLRVNLAIAYDDIGDRAAAERTYRAVLAIRPNHVEAASNLANLLARSGRLSEAEALHRKVLAARPDDAYSTQALAFTLCDQGRIEEALELFRNVAERTQSAAAWSLYLSYSQHVGTDAEGHRQWAKRFARVFREAPALPWDGVRPLRIGYLSGSFRQCATASFFEPLLSHHDRGRVNVTCYSDVPKPDATSARLYSLADAWRDVSKFNHEQLDRLIRADRIDVLVDLDGHKVGGRMLTLVRKPAPVCGTLFGYCSDTGVSQNFNVGQWAFQPHADAPDVSSLPAARNGYITFGSFHRACKITKTVADTWSKLLARVPDSRLVVLAQGGEHNDALRTRLESAGIPGERLKLIPHASQREYLAAAGLIDVHLDTFPYNGVTTTCEMLWQGVPTLTLKTEDRQGQCGAEILTLAGLPEWIADSEADYLDRAARLTRDIPRLMEMRVTMRDWLTASPLLDGKAMASRMEDLYDERVAVIQPEGSPGRIGRRKAFPPGTPTYIVRLARNGDLLTLLPALKYLVTQQGRNIVLVVNPKYEPLVKGIPWLTYETFDGDVDDRETWGKAMRHYSRIGYTPEEQCRSNWAHGIWSRSEVPTELYQTLPLEIENRDPEAEAKIVAQHRRTARPLILVNTAAVHSPYPHRAELMEFLYSKFGSRCEILDLSDLRAERIIDLLGLYEDAAVLVSVDTGTLHLGYATGTPTVGIVADGTWDASPARPHWRERITYADSVTRKGLARIEQAIADVLTGQESPRRWRETRIHALTVCVGDHYAQLLAQCLPKNRVHFDSYTIVTTEADRLTRVICAAHDVKVVLTQRLKINGAIFNKGAAINDALQELYINHFGDWIAHIDADMLLPDNTRGYLNATDLDAASIYGMHRDGPDPSAEQHVKPISGFFQLWHASSGYFYDEHHPDAGKTDILFRDLWPAEKQNVLDLRARHLGLPGVNWKGEPPQPTWSPQAAWAELHHRPSIATDLSKETQWLEGFIDRIPCPNCRRDLRENRLKKRPPDFSSPDNYFRFTVDLHNDVNRDLKKPEMTIEQAARIHGFSQHLQEIVA